MVVAVGGTRSSCEAGACVVRELPQTRDASGLRSTCPRSLPPSRGGSEAWRRLPAPVVSLGVGESRDSRGPLCEVG